LQDARYHFLREVKQKGIFMDIEVNGKKYKVAPGCNITITDDDVVVNGRSISELEEKKELRIIINGDVQKLEVRKGNVEVKGNAGSVSSGGSVRCEDVGGNVECGGSVTCKNIKGNVDCGGSLSGGNIGGEVSAGGSINCASAKKREYGIGGDYYH
jgi:hypothetical protein